MTKEEIKELRDAIGIWLNKHFAEKEASKISSNAVLCSSLPSDKLKKIFKDIMDYQMDHFEIARATEQYKLAEEGFHIIINFENDTKRGNGA